MTFMQYLSTTVYRYYIKQIATTIKSIIQTKSAIILEVDFRNPRSLDDGDFRNPRSLDDGDFRNPRGTDDVDFQDITEIVP